MVKQAFPANRQTLMLQILRVFNRIQIRQKSVCIFGLISGLSEDKVESMFPTAAATSKLLKSGMTLTQVKDYYIYGKRPKI